MEFKIGDNIHIGAGEYAEVCRVSKDNNQISYFIKYKLDLTGAGMGHWISGELVDNYNIPLLRQKKLKELGI